MQRELCDHHHNEENVLDKDQDRADINTTLNTYYVPWWSRRTTHIDMTHWKHPPPRRSGKTTGLASVVASLLICVPQTHVIVDSTAKRSAEEFVRLVKRYIRMHSPDGGQGNQ